MAKGRAARGRGFRVFLVALLLASPANSLQYDDGGSYDATRHDRFVPGTFPSSPVPNPSSLLSGHASQLTGVGWQTNAPGKKVTLVSPQHFVNADHYKASGSLSFLDASGNVRTYGIATNEMVYGDLAVGTLVAPIPAEDGISHLSVASFANSDHAGREVLYVGNPPTGNGFSAGRTAIASTSANSVWLDNSLVDPSNSIDRAYGITGDSGSPSLFEESDGLSFVGTHYSAFSDQTAGSSVARAALDDYLAADGQLLDLYGEGRLGDPGAGDLVVTGIAQDLGIHFDPPVGQTEVVTIRFHDFSGNGSSVEASVVGADFALRIPGTTQLLQALAVVAPADASGADLEVVYTASGSGIPGSLSVSDAGNAYVIPLDDDAPDPGLRPATMVATPKLQSGSSGNNDVPGDMRTFTVTVANNDVGDSDAQFELAATCPAAYPGETCSPGWTVVLDASTITVAPGSQTSVDVTVTPANGADIAPYVISLSAQDAAAPIHDAEVAMVYSVDSIAPDVLYPTTPTGLWATGNSSSTTLTWNASQDDVGVSHYDVIRDGARIDSSQTTSWTDFDTQLDQTYDYLVYAVDLTGKKSALSAPISVVNGAVVGDGGNDICVPTRTREKGRTCRDGIDNDCDGQIDAADSDC